MFTDEEIKFLKKFKLKKTFDLNDDDIFEMEDAVSNFLQINGFDKDYKITKDGLIAENILDKIFEY
ncbi:MAG: hypothetical protein ACLUJM_12220 [Finegoldia sp.]|uniref:hypothetical protein n=1 Tax=Finegoldia sp. TaxID=1981334 RepID=UPI0028FDE634|nr:hypothetical protein [Finegoldia magna]MDU1879115.1 hypothetical protein [Finegoldia magna]